MSNPMSQREIFYGSCYALFQLFILPEIAAIVKHLMALPGLWMQIGIFAVNFIGTILIFRQFLQKSWETFLEKFRQILVWVSLGLLGYYLVSFLFGYLTQLFYPAYRNLNDAGISHLADQNRLVMIFGTVLLVPLAEETLFRGLLFRGLYDRKPVTAWILSVGLFSLVHIVGYLGSYNALQLLLAFVQYLPAGLVLCLVYRMTDTIIAPVLMHTLINFVGMILI